MTKDSEKNHLKGAGPKTVLVAVTDIFFYTKVRDALLPNGYTLERARSQDDIALKASAAHPAAVILNMNDETLNAFQALETLRTKSMGVTKIVSRNEFSMRTKELVEGIMSRTAS